MTSFQTVNLGELISLERRPIDVVHEGKYAEIGIYCFGRGIFHKPPRSGVEVGNKDLFLIKEGDFILQVTFAWEGAVALASASEDGMYGSVRYPTFRVKEELCFPPYLVNYFRTPQGREQLIRISPGSAGRNRVLSMKRIPDIKIPLPSINEQKRIVARIEELAVKIAEALKLRRQALDMADAFLEAGVEAAFQVVREHKREKLANVTSKIGSGSTPLGGKAAYPSSGVPFIRSMNVRMRNFSWQNIAFISEETHQAMKGTQVKPGDVLFNITGASIGRVTCTPNDLQTANVSQHVSIIRPLENLDSRYLMCWLSQRSVQNHVDNEQKGATRQGFTKAQIAAMEIPVPPLIEQQRVVGKVEELQVKVNSLKHLQSQTADELDAMLPAVLDKAFKGEL